MQDMEEVNVLIELVQYMQVVEDQLLPVVLILPILLLLPLLVQEIMQIVVVI